MSFSTYDITNRILTEIEIGQLSIKKTKVNNIITITKNCLIIFVFLSISYILYIRISRQNVGDHHYPT